VTPSAPYPTGNMGNVPRKLTAYDYTLISLLIVEAEHRIEQMGDDSGQDSGSDSEMADIRSSVGFLRHIQRAGELISV
jgi:hypothetical protein